MIPGQVPELAAVAAYGAWCGETDTAQVIIDWRLLGEAERVGWYAIADAVRSVLHGEIRACYCGTEAMVVPGVFPHPDCDGSAPAAVTAAAAAQPGDLRDVAAEAIAAYEASVSYDETPHDRSRVAGWRARLAAAAQPAPGDRAFRSDLVDAMLRWSGRDRADADECAQELAAILDKHPAPQAPATPARDLDDLLGEALTSFTTQEQPAPGLAAAPELRAAMAETRKVQDTLARILSDAVKGSSGWTIRIGQVPLARAWAATGKPVPEELRRFL